MCRHFFTNDLTNDGSNVKVPTGSGAAGQKGRAGVIWTSSPADGGRWFFDNFEKEELGVRSLAARPVFGSNLVKPSQGRSSRGGTPGEGTGPTGRVVTA